MRVPIASLSLLIVASFAYAQDKSDHMPLKVGNKWTYKVEVSGQNIAATQKVTKIEKKDGKQVASIETDIGGMTITEQLSSGDTGVFRYSFQGMAVDPPIQVLRLPVKKGESWEVKFKLMDQQHMAKLKTEDEEEVTVPAGKYKAVIVSMEMEIMDQKITAKSWFAPKVGIVKQTFSIAGMDGTLELEKVELEK